MLQSGLSRYYIQKFAEVSAIFVVIAISAYAFFDEPIVADILQNIIFICVGISFRKDKNLLIIIVVILFGRLLSQAFFYVDVSHDKVLAKGTIYLFVTYFCYYFRYDNLAKFSLSLIFCMVVAELYWLYVKYEESPEISYYAVILVENICVRHLILNRASFFGVWKNQLNVISIDWQLHNLFGLYILVTAAMVVEYFIRHMLNIQTILIYNIYSPTFYLINATILWIILNYALKKTALFQA
jgi:hypothetical protein